MLIRYHDKYTQTVEKNRWEGKTPTPDTSLPPVEHETKTTLVFEGDIWYLGQSTCPKGLSRMELFETPYKITWTDCETKSGVFDSEQYANKQVAKIYYLEKTTTTHCHEGVDYFYACVPTESIKHFDEALKTVLKYT